MRLRGHGLGWLVFALFVSPVVALWTGRRARPILKVSDISKIRPR